MAREKGLKELIQNNLGSLAGITEKSSVTFLSHI